MNESIIPSSVAYRQQKRAGRLDDFARRTIIKKLSNIKLGRIELFDGKQHYQFGTTTDDFDLTARVWVHDQRFYRSIIFGGNMGAGESFMAGFWSTNHLTDLIRIILRNQAAVSHMDGGWSRITAPLHKLYHYLRRNSRRGSRSNIKAHYDLGNEFYQLFLDDTWTYSSGIFESADSTLEDASIAKYDRICRKLDLSSDDHILEIGTGWGGFALHAAGRYRCRVTTTTISDEQYDMARKRVADAGLDHLVTVLKKDYRDIEGAFDKLVSIEMIEAVGHQYYRTFFKKCSQLLKPHGSMAIQAITIGDHIFDQHKYTVDFIKRYIFPGSCIPSITALHQAMAKASDLRLFHMEDITPHYAETLRMWRERFFENIESVKAMGFPDSFLRMWDYYLSYCEAGFAERHIGDVQMVFNKPLSRREPILGSL